MTYSTRASDTPLLSIVTPIKNGLRFLPACLASVDRLRRSGAPIEHIVIDGGSTDGTLDLLERHGRATVVVLPSLPADRATLAGTERSRGRFIFLLMSDDELTESFSSFLEAVATSPEPIDLALADCRMVDELAQRPDRMLHYPRSIADILHGYPGLNSALVARRLWKATIFPENLPLTNDRLLMLSFFVACRAIMVWRRPIATMRAHDASRTHAQGRDVGAIKRELNRAALDLLAQNAGGPCEAVLSVSAWRSALSLVKERMMARAGGGASSIWRRQANLATHWPAPASLRLVPRGLMELWQGRDRLFAPVSAETPTLAIPRLRGLRSGATVANDPTSLRGRQTTAC